MLLAFMAVTAWRAWQRRQLVILASFTTGMLLVCDDELSPIASASSAAPRPSSSVAVSYTHLTLPTKRIV